MIGHVFEVNAGDFAGDFVDPGGGIGAAVLDPIGVDLHPDFGGELVEEGLEGNFAVVAGEFMAVVVVADAEAGVAIFFGRCVVGAGEIGPVFGDGFFGEEAADGGVLAAARGGVRR